MVTHKLSENEIAIRIVPQHARWPESSTSVAWTQAHTCVNSLKDFIRKVDFDCSEVEQDRELSPSAIHQRRAQIYDRSMMRLANFRPFHIAEKALIENIDALERLADRDPEQAEMLQKLTKALAELREGIPASRRMLADRCKTRHVVSV